MYYAVYAGSSPHRQSPLTLRVSHTGRRTIEALTRDRSAVTTVRVPNRASTWPSPPMTNFVKFQRMASPTFCGWPCPAGGAGSSAPRQNLKTSCVSLPLTSTLEKTVVLSTSRMPRLLINSLISSCVPGSWPPNWLQGNSSVAKLPAPYFFAISVSSL